ncbi:MAG TPA: DUF1634 domain-containing protein [Terriglobales bacterium]
MSTPPTGKGVWSDQRIENTVGRLLQIGVTSSAVVVIIGAMIYLARHGTDPVSYNIFHGEPADYRTFRGILHGVATWHGRGFIQLGLLMLIATPVARVAFSVWGFAEEKDHLYIAFTLVVLAVLLYSLFGSGSAF